MSFHSSSASVYSDSTVYTHSPLVKEGLEVKQKKSKREMLKSIFTIPPGVEQTVEGRMHRQSPLRSTGHM
ncbi:conserved hypothetical protein [Geotrichum candidum]|uniref:Uncharacterized protein n=1 Tax=Geotrichum candidum TaxID=1173061 RepID=A0A0J9XFL5_GEOCN|nr:conserved hypothetical protein [Geotrichum candidum]